MQSTDSMPSEEDVSINMPHCSKIVNKFPAFSVVIETTDIIDSTPEKAKPDFAQSCIMSEKKDELVPDVHPLPLHSSKSVGPFKNTSHWKKLKNGFRAIAGFRKIECKKLLTGVLYYAGTSL